MIKLNQVKELEFHDEYAVKDAAFVYLEKGGQSDPGDAARALALYENAPNDIEASHWLRVASRMRHDAGTLRRLLETGDENLALHVDDAAAKADITVLEAAVSTGAPDRCAQILEQRKDFAQTPAAALWDMLWEHSARADGIYFGDFDFILGELIAAELAGRADFPRDAYCNRIDTIYDEGCHDWDDVYLCCLAGELKNDDNIEFLLDSLENGEDLLCEKAAEALSRIGSPRVIRETADRFARADLGFKIFAGGVFEGMQTEDCETAVIKLLTGERDVTAKTVLADALCGMFSEKGITSCLNMLRDGYDDSWCRLETGLYTTCIAHGLTFPEMDAWRRLTNQEHQRMLEIEKKMRDGGSGPDETDFADALAKLAENRQTIDRLQREYNKKPKTGRNDPCPCGSGKKYKKCCGK